MKLLLILLFITIKTLESKLVFDIFADKEPTITFSGTANQIVTNDDIQNLFGLHKRTMKEFVSDYLNGETPKRIRYSPTKSKNDPYKRYNWDPVMQISTVQSASKQSVFAPPVPAVVFSRSIINPTNETKKVNAGIEMPVAIALKTVWRFSDDDFEQIHDEVFDINLTFAENSGLPSITHSSVLWRDSEVYERLTIGRANYEVELQPGQSAIAKFSAKICNLELKAQLATSVTGNIAAYYKTAVNGSHYYGPKIEDVLKSADFSSRSEIQENLTIKVDFYFDAKVEVFDKDTGAQL